MRHNSRIGVGSLPAMISPATTRMVRATGKIAMGMSQTNIVAVLCVVFEDP